MKQKSIDLHSHSTVSDGTMTPESVIGLAKTQNLSAIALTDHDCIDGLEAAMAEGKQQGIEVVPGLEISAKFDKGTMHILGFFIDPQAGSLRKQLNQLQEGRRQRNPRIVKKLQSLGLDITYDEVVEASGGGQVGRPHFAKVLIQKGYVSSIEEAFEKFLKKGAPGYMEKFGFSPQKSIELIHQAGGVAVIAHPFTLGLSTSEMEQGVMSDLKRAGLDGIEVYYSKNSPRDTLHYMRLCDNFELLPSGGSDFHGENKPGINLGVGRGDLSVPYQLLEDLRNKAREYQQKVSSS